MTDVTRILTGIVNGEPRAAAQLLPLVYDELRRLAARRLAHEPASPTLQATELVHEAYLRLVGVDDPGWNGRGHFFAAAAEAMRRILIDNARKKRSAKAGGGWHRLELIDRELAVDTSGDDLFAVDEALTRLAAKHPRQAQLVHLRFFLEMTVQEAASYLGVAERTAERDWKYVMPLLRLDLDRNT